MSLKLLLQYCRFMCSLLTMMNPTIMSILDMTMETKTLATWIIISILQIEAWLSSWRCYIYRVSTGQRKRRRLQWQHRNAGPENKREEIVDVHFEAGEPQIDCPPYDFSILAANSDFAVVLQVLRRSPFTRPILPSNTQTHHRLMPDRMQPYPNLWDYVLVSLLLSMRGGRSSFQRLYNLKLLKKLKP